MTVAIQNVDQTLLSLIKNAISLNPQGKYILEENVQSYVKPEKSKTKEQIVAELKKDIELIKQGKLKTYPHGTRWKYLR